MSTLAVNTITDASGGNTAQINGATPTVYNTMGRNRIINGDMRIDQRNAGASVSLTSGGVFTVDRFFSYTNGALAIPAGLTAQQTTIAPSGFVNSLKYATTTGSTASSAQAAGLSQLIEGLNVADFGWGAVGASTITLSFWVRSSVTGTYGVAFGNSANDRNYVATYTVSAANTWEQKAITIAGDTTGTWLTSNGIGLRLRFDLGSGSGSQITSGSWQSGSYTTTSAQANWIGTASATFYITGVQLEAGSVATPFERRSYGTELALCQRYYYKNQASGTGYSCFGSSFNGTTANVYGITMFPVTMRDRPTALEQSGTAGNYAVIARETGYVCTGVPIFHSSTNQNMGRYIFAVTGVTAGEGSSCHSATGNSAAYLAWSAEL